MVLTVTALAAATALGRPGEGIRIGNLAISPFAGLSITYDDNVFLTKTDEKEDFFTDVVPGIAVLNRTERLILRGRLWGQFRNYFDYDEKDSEGWGERLSVLLGTEQNPFLLVEQKYVRLEDYELYPRSVDTLNIESQRLLLTEDRTERVKRNLFDIGGVVGRWVIEEKLRLDAGYGFGFVDYDESRLLDWLEHKLQAEGQYRLTERTAALLTGQYGVQDSDGFPKNSSRLLVRGGLSTQLTGKTAVKAGVGYESYDAGFVSAVGDSLDHEVVAFDVAAFWDATTKMRLEASARNGIQPAAQYDANTKVLYLGQLGGSYEVTDTILFTLAGSYRYDDYIGRIPFGGDLRDKHRRHWGARARLDYRPRAKFYDFYTEATFEDVKDNLEDDYENYDQFRVVAGAFLRY
jgi:hypothetical protein